MNKGNFYPTENLLAFPIHTLEKMVSDMRRMLVTARPAEKQAIAQAIAGFDMAINILKFKCDEEENTDGEINS